MKTPDVLAEVRYVTDVNGNKTEVLVPVRVWQALLTSWQELISQLEDKEDSAILKEWLEKRAAGEIKMVALETLEQELITDGLLPS
ncbi:MAG: hypothetical protein F6K41_30835 [Symploca sp. SIO3E6]|nr:hypothetical protein [Caldora sp. SIO3E6]